MASPRTRRVLGELKPQDENNVSKTHQLLSKQRQKPFGATKQSIKQLVNLIVASLFNRTQVPFSPSVLLP